MYGLGAGHVWEIPLEFSLGAGYGWLTWEKVERPDMSSQSLLNPARGPDMSGLTGVFGGRIDLRIYERKDVPRKRIFAEIIQGIVERLRI
jgi:hypothetical protein